MDIVYTVLHCPCYLKCYSLRYLEQQWQIMYLVIEALPYGTKIFSPVNTGEISTGVPLCNLPSFISNPVILRCFKILIIMFCIGYYYRG